MKCLKNKTTGNVIRVDDKQAYQMAGSTWEYVSKDVWKKTNGVKTEKVEVTHDMGGPIEKPVSKKKKEKKSAE